jgi:glutamate N-acetyltransferase/amino-acid N-acetyltransferase
MTTSSQLTQEPLIEEDDVPRGFRFGAVRAGIKSSGNLDLSCVAADQPATAAAMFTSNAVVAAPVVVGKRHLLRGNHQVRAVVINAGNANCATGEAGIVAAEQVCSKAAEVFGCEGHSVFPSSTGIIGVPLPVEKVVAALPSLEASLGGSAAHLELMARAILTTDTRLKIAATRFEVGGSVVRLAGAAKGAGMIFPQLGEGPSAPHATMLVYIFTDAILQPETANRLLHQAVEETFNRISIDGDTSTNDTVLLLASGASGVSIDPIEEKIFGSALHRVCLSLAQQIVGDGEGIQHVVELVISGALSDSDALRVARAIAHSPLVKTSWAGCDPNWGRILAAIGYSGVTIDPALVNIRLGDIELCRMGGVSSHLDKAAAHEYLKQRDLVIRVDLGLGQGTCRFWTTDLTAEYVRINSEYSS